VGSVVDSHREIWEQAEEEADPCEEELLTGCILDVIVVTEIKSADDE